MKTSNYQVSKAVLLLLFFVTSISYSQINFEDSNLAILEKVAFNSNYDNLKKFMKDNGYEFEDTFTEYEIEGFTFTNAASRLVMVGYTSSKVLYGVSIIIPEVTRVFGIMELKDNKFTYTPDDEYAEEVLWKKSGYPYQFNIQKDKEEAAAVIMLFTKANESYEQ